MVGNHHFHPFKSWLFRVSGVFHSSCHGDDYQQRFCLHPQDRVFFFAGVNCGRNMALTDCVFFFDVDRKRRVEEFLVGGSFKHFFFLNFHPGFVRR